MKRTYSKILEQIMKEKQMIFLPGPRQVGKTTIAKSISEGYTYFT